MNKKINHLNHFFSPKTLTCSFVDNYNCNNHSKILRVLLICAKLIGRYFIVQGIVGLLMPPFASKEPPMYTMLKEV